MLDIAGAQVVDLEGVVDRGRCCARRGKTGQGWTFFVLRYVVRVDWVWRIIPTWRAARMDAYCAARGGIGVEKRKLK